LSQIYTDGQYKENNPDWHAEDSPWKALQVFNILKNNKISPKNIAEIGCGAGNILVELEKLLDESACKFSGYDISPQAIEMAKKNESESVKFFQEDLLTEDDKEPFDLIMAMDVFEHVPDYMGFLEKLKTKARYKVYHIPLDLHVSSVLRNSFLPPRYTIGHLHYFTGDSALATLKDTGHEIIDYEYTNAAFDLFRTHPSVKKAIANIPRWLVSRVSVSLSARLFGGYSLLVLTK
jgi:SAM-dependent methyltransferase